MSEFQGQGFLNLLSGLDKIQLGWYFTWQILIPIAITFLERNVHRRQPCIRERRDREALLRELKAVELQDQAQPGPLPVAPQPLSSRRMMRVRVV